MGWTEGIEYVNVFSSWAKSGDYVYAKEMALPYDIQGNELVAPQTTTRFEPNPPLDRSRYERPDRGI
jgi:hypothetical protein